MKRSKEKSPHIEVITSPRGLRPLTAWDSEALMMIPEGVMFSLTPITKRSEKQLRTYWRGLGIVVKSTGKWSTAENLHREIKLTLGYVEKVVNLRTGEISLVPDSVALDKMDPSEFRSFMDSAMQLITEATGFDPLSFLDEEK